MLKTLNSLLTLDWRFSEHINCLSLIFNVESDTILEDFLELKDFKETMKMPITRSGNESFNEITAKLNNTVSFLPRRYPSMPVFAKFYGSRSSRKKIPCNFFTNFFWHNFLKFLMETLVKGFLTTYSSWQNISRINIFWREKIGQAFIIIIYIWD